MEAQLAECNEDQLSQPAATAHNLVLGDARQLGWIPDASVHLVVTSPPYWTLKKYNDSPGQFGAAADYEAFMDQLDLVWTHCARVLVPGGRVVSVVGDVCLSHQVENGSRRGIRNTRLALVVTVDNDRAIGVKAYFANPVSDL